MDIFSHLPLQYKVVTLLKFLTPGFETKRGSSGYLHAVFLSLVVGFVEVSLELELENLRWNLLRVSLGGFTVGMFFFLFFFRHGEWVGACKWRSLRGESGQATGIMIIDRSQEVEAERTKRNRGMKDGQIVKVGVCSSKYRSFKQYNILGFPFERLFSVFHKFHFWTALRPKHSQSTRTELLFLYSTASSSRALALYLPIIAARWKLGCRKADYHKTSIDLTMW